MSDFQTPHDRTLKLVCWAFVECRLNKAVQGQTYIYIWGLSRSQIYPQSLKTLYKTAFVTFLLCMRQTNSGIYLLPDSKSELFISSTQNAKSMAKILFLFVSPLIQRLFWIKQNKSVKCFILHKLNAMKIANSTL